MSTLNEVRDFSVPAAEQQQDEQTISGSMSFDPLELYDLVSIGAEFIPSMPRGGREEADLRRGEVIAKAWRDSFGRDGEKRTPTREHFKTTRKFETQHASSVSFLTLLVFLAIMGLGAAAAALLVLQFGKSLPF